jgi:hypothetical protein
MMGVLTLGVKVATSTATSSAWMAKELNLLHAGTFHALEASQICRNSSSATGDPATVAVAGEEAPDAECSWSGRYFLMCVR